MDVADLRRSAARDVRASRRVRGGRPAARLVGLVRGVHGRSPGRERPGRGRRGRDRYMADVKQVVVPSMNAIDADALPTTAGVRIVVPVLDAPQGRPPQPGYCRVTFDHPPINTITATTVAELAELVGLIEQDPDLNVVVFDSANPDFYLAHYDIENDPARTAALGVGPTGHARVARSPRPSVPRAGGQHRLDPRTRPRRGKRVRARLRPAVRLAREHAARPVRGRHRAWSPGAVRWPGSSRLVGRGRALEILLVADDLDGPRAEQYGYVNRVIADDRLDDEVDAIAVAARALRPRRDRAHEVLRRPGDAARRQRASGPPSPTSSSCSARPAQQAQSARLEELGLNTDSDLERSLGRRVVEALPDA